IVAIGVTVVVYGAVALIVKTDDAGLALAHNDRPISSLLGLLPGGGGVPGTADRAVSGLTRRLGRGLVIGMPYFLKALSTLGTAAMLWVGGGIIIHGLEEFGLSGVGHVVHDIAETAGETIPAVAGALEWLGGAVASGLFGLVVGALLIPLVHTVAVPVVARLRAR
ncbi:DUF808 family protein, partial [Skermanella aerolata]|uniref:DUF808 family protein n=1 Tax=Skermanella aerolata TaxID=393310 RepID=UPI0005CB636A